MTENRTITVAGCQISQNFGNREANMVTIIRLITPYHIKEVSNEN